MNKYEPYINNKDNACIIIESTFTYFSDKFKNLDENDIDDYDLPKNKVLIYKDNRKYTDYLYKSKSCKNFNIHRLKFKSKKIGKDIGVTFNKKFSLNEDIELTNIIKLVINDNSEPFSSDKKTLKYRLLFDLAKKNNIYKSNDIQNNKIKEPIIIKNKDIKSEINLKDNMIESINSNIKETSNKNNINNINKNNIDKNKIIEPIINTIELINPNIKETIDKNKIIELTTETIDKNNIDEPIKEIINKNNIDEPIINTKIKETKNKDINVEIIMDSNKIIKNEQDIIGTKNKDIKTDTIKNTINSNKYFYILETNNNIKFGHDDNIEKIKEIMKIYLEHHIITYL